MERRRLAIIGAGLAGLSTAWHGKGDRVVLERGERPGGLAVTDGEAGFRFDVTGHWLHMRNPEMRRQFHGLTPMAEIARRSAISSHGRLVAYPFQSNLKDLPHPVRMECLMGAIEAHCRRTGDDGGSPPFGDFVERHFGEGIAREFMFPYNQKLWGVRPNDISQAWCQRFVPVPDLRQIVEGAFTDANERDGYNAGFSHPKEGGIGAFSAALAEQVSGLIDYRFEVALINPAERWLESAAGRRLSYSRLVSTMALPELVKRLAGVPEEVAAAAGRLRCAPVRYFNLGLDRTVLAGLHWLYLPDPRLIPYRIGSFSNASPGMAPAGCASLYVELANDREFDEEEALEQVLTVLSALGPSVGRENVVVWQRRRVDYGYVLYDHDYARCRQRVLDYLCGMGIISTGRYGGWVYAAMEDALLDGRAAAAASSGD